MFERPRTGERALLVHVEFSTDHDPESFDEFEELALSAGAQVIGRIRSSRHKPDPKYLIGTGKVEEIAELVDMEGIELVLFNQSLSPAQERNLEKKLQCRVLDRTGLILDIFAQRARSFEGKLQVELAQLKHLSTRLVRGWTHLERQKGGIGLRGPGETQLETDRRLLGNRIKQLNKRLEKVSKQRAQGRAARKKAEMPTVSLVGYTNAGKSTLFNKLTGAGVYSADQLFATLDPTLRKIEVPSVGPVVLADTVGFIRHLPHDLVAAFQSTLQESAESQLLLHVIDAHDEERQDHKVQVYDVLKQIHADEVPQIEVYNKIDLLNQEPHIDRNEKGEIERVWLSAVTGEGLDLLLNAIAERLDLGILDITVQIPMRYGGSRAKLFECATIVDEKITPEGEWLIHCRLPGINWDQLSTSDQFFGKIVENHHGNHLATDLIHS